MKRTKAAEWADGVLSSSQIISLVDGGHIGAETCRPSMDAVQPASLDLRLGRRVWGLRAGFCPGPETVRQTIEELALFSMDLAAAPCLLPGVIYIAEIEESLHLPADVRASFSPKSSTGRLDVFTRVLAEGATGFDKAPHGYSGPLYLEISPRTFPVVVGAGTRLCQVRFHKGPCGEDARPRTTLAVDLGRTGADVVGYKALRDTPAVDLVTATRLPAGGFWSPMRRPPSGRLVLEPGAFYLLASREDVTVPSDACAEMVPFDATLGEFRAHYAGFFDPGFGLDGAGGSGSKAVLEVRVHDMPFMLRDGQPICRMAWESMSEEPTALYGAGRASGQSYQGQGLKMPRIFDQD